MSPNNTLSWLSNTGGFLRPPPTRSPGKQWRSYRVLADSERAIQRSRRIVDALGEVGIEDEEKTVAEIKPGS